MKKISSRIGIKILAGGLVSLFFLTSCQKKSTEPEIAIPSIAISGTTVPDTSVSNISTMQGSVIAEDTEYFTATETASISLGENGEYWRRARIGSENGMVELGQIYDLDNQTITNEENVLLFFDAEAKLHKQINIRDMITDSYNHIYGIYPAGKNEFVIAVYPQWESENADQRVWLYRYDFSGNQAGDRIVVEKKLNNGEGRVQFYSFLIDENGQIFTLCELSSPHQGQNLFLSVFDASGTEIFTLEKDKDSWEFANQFFVFDGHVYAAAYDKKGSFLISIDTAQQSFGERTACPEFNFYQTQLIGDSLYESNGFFLRKMNMQNEQITNIFEWKNLDIPDGSSSDWVMISENKIMVESRSEDLRSIKWFLLEKVEKNPNAGKKVIQIVGLNVDVDRAVYQYNQVNQEYRIEVRNYSDKIFFETEDAKQAQFVQLQMDMLSGNMPDILIDDMNSYLNFPMLSSRGIFADLNPLMAADPDFDENNYFKNILKIYEKDGKLFYLCTEFTMQGILANGNLSGNIHGWTFEEFAAFADNLPDGVALFENGMTGDRLLTGILNNSFEDFIDYENKTADFQSERFISLMNFCKNYARTAGGPVDDISINNGALPVDIIMKNGELALYSGGYISSVERYRMALSNYGENVVVMGYPSVNGGGPVCSPNTLVGISASSQYQETAWEFVSQLLGEKEQQDTTGWPMLPLLKSVFEEQVREQMKSQGEDMYYPPLTEASAELLRQTISSITIGNGINNQILLIIETEIQSFFSSDKPAEAVAETIQSRVQTYLNEL